MEKLDILSKNLNILFFDNSHFNQNHSLFGLIELKMTCRMVK